MNAEIFNCMPQTDLRICDKINHEYKIDLWNHFMYFSNGSVKMAWWSWSI